MYSGSDYALVGIQRPLLLARFRIGTGSPREPGRGVNQFKETHERTLYTRYETYLIPGETLILGGSVSPWLQ